MEQTLLFSKPLDGVLMSSILDWDDYNVPENKPKSTASLKQEKPLEPKVTAPVAPVLKAVEAPTQGTPDQMDARARLAAMALLGTDEEPFMGGERLKASDKKIVKGSSDVNQLIPFKYHWAWQKYLDGCANHWMPTEINMTRDLEQWVGQDTLSEDERRMVNRTFGFFSVADTMVANNLVQTIYNNVSAPEVRQYLLRQMFEEGLHCYVDGTEILTENGFEDFRFLKAGVKVAQYHPDGEVTFVVPSEIIHSAYNGEVIEFRNDSSNYHSVVTPNHRCIAWDPRSGTTPKAELACEISLHNKVIPVSGHAYLPGKKCYLTDWERLKIAFQADGHLCNPHTKEKGLMTGKYMLRFQFKRQRKIDRLLGLIETLNLEHKISLIGSGKNEGHTVIYVWVPNSNVLDKTFDWVKLDEVDSLWCSDFIEELAHWDGCARAPSSILYANTNEAAIDKVTAIAHLCGRRTGLYEIEGTEKSRPCWQLHIYCRHIASGRGVHKQVLNYNGDVHCVTVPTGMIIVRYRGCVTVSGNSHSYQHILQSLRMDEGESFNMYREVPSIASKMSWALKISSKLAKLKINEWTTDNILSDFIEGLAVYYCVIEGVFFYCGFAQILGLGRRNLLPSCGEQIAYILRDESAHAAFGIDLINEIKNENPQVWTSALQQRILDKFMEGYLLECDYIKDTIPNGILGMNYELHSQYLRFILNRRCIQIGLPTMFKEEPNPYPWMSEMMDLRKESNFFERRKMICALAS